MKKVATKSIAKKSAKKNASKVKVAKAWPETTYMGFSEADWKKVRTLGQSKGVSMSEFFRNAIKSQYKIG